MKQGLIIILLILTACNTIKKDNIFCPPPLESQDTLCHETIETDEIFSSAMCMFLIDSILFIEDSFYRDTLVWGFHTGEKKVTTAYARKGRGPGEVLSTSSNIQYDGSMNHFRLYDVNSKKLIEYNTKNKNFAEYQLPYKDALFRENFVQELIKTDSGYLGMGTGSLFSTEKRFLLFDDRYELKNTFEGYPRIDGISLADMAEIYLYAEEIRIKPDGSRLVYATYIGGILEIFDLQHLPDSLPLIRRHLYYRPVYEKNKSGIFATPEGTKYGFENIYVTDQAIYALLFASDRPEMAFPNKMLVYDWDGNWIRT